LAICETASAMAPSLAPNVRSQFAKRLKSIRTLRGFGRARYFAKSLGIEENRYTRYERAEVEPSLTLIHKMCDMLRVTPNELLGFAEVKPERGFTMAVGLSESDDTAHPYQHANAEHAGNAGDPLSSVAWQLASAAVAIRHEHTGKPKASSDPLDTVRETSALFRSLQQSPFGAVAEIVDDPTLKSIDAGRKSTLAKLIQSFTEQASKRAAPQGR
jgi:transcriptional regulator with XRE-family HTH domain